jgi:putative addiction module component (TIGR02574 family)
MIPGRGISLIWSTKSFRPLSEEHRIMTVSAVQLLEDALRLSEKERADMAARLIDSLDPVVESDAASAWDAEVGRRLGELDTGVVEPLNWPDARRIISGENDAAPGA